MFALSLKMQTIPRQVSTKTILFAGLFHLWSIPMGCWKWYFWSDLAKRSWQKIWGCGAGNHCGRWDPHPREAVPGAGKGPAQVPIPITVLSTKSPWRAVIKTALLNTTCVASKTKSNQPTGMVTQPPPWGAYMHWITYIWEQQQQHQQTNKIVTGLVSVTMHTSTLRLTLSFIHGPVWPDVFNSCGHYNLALAFGWL